MSLRNSIEHVERWLTTRRRWLDVFLVKDLEHLIRVAKEAESVSRDEQRKEESAT